MYKKVSEQNIAPMEAELKEIIRLSEDFQCKVIMGTVLPEDISRFNWAMDNLLMHAQFCQQRPRQNRTESRKRQVLFNYNGETFDAFQILGLPDVVTPDFARAFFEKTYGSSPSDEQVLYRMALESLEQAH